MKKNRVRSLLALGLSLTMMVSIMGCGKQQRLDAEINPDTPVSDVQFPLKETEELSFITSAPATSTQDPNKRVIFQRMEEQLHERKMEQNCRCRQLQYLHKISGKQFFQKSKNNNFQFLYTHRNEKEYQVRH